MVENAGARFDWTDFGRSIDTLRREGYQGSNRFRRGCAVGLPRPDGRPDWIPDSYSLTPTVG
jgi:hypothetical protein